MFRFENLHLNGQLGYVEREGFAHKDFEGSWAVSLRQSMNSLSLLLLLSLLYGCGAASQESSPSIIGRRRIRLLQLLLFPFLPKKQPCKRAIQPRPEEWSR